MYSNLRFIRCMSMKNVVRADDPNKLADHIVIIIEELRRNGKNPHEEFQKCLDYVESGLRMVDSEYNPNDRMITSHNPRRVGSKAWWLYMRKNLRKIVQILAVERINQLLDI